MRRASADPLATMAGLDGTAPGLLRVEAPEIQRLGDEWAATWPAHGVTLSLGQLRESTDGIHGELSVVSGVLGEIHWGRLNLASTSAREGLVRKLDQAAPGLPWRPILERVCRQAARDLRSGEPARPLVPRLADEVTRYLVPKLLLAGETNIIFADGGSGKSLLALAIAEAVRTGTALPGGLVPTAAVPTLFLDYESHRPEHEDRLARLQEAGGASADPPIFYRPMTRALADEASTLRAEIARHEVGLVIVDSLAPACGPEPEGADAVVRTMTALRSFAPATRLVLAHVSKLAAEQRSGPVKPFGSAFVFNLARNIWELRKADEDGGADLVIAAFHRKSNAGRLYPPLGFRFIFREGMTSLHAHDIGQAPDLLARTSLAFQIQKTLVPGAQTVADLVEATGSTKDTVARTLRRLRGAGKVIPLDEGRWGLSA
ncbi:MAG: AAA family ATPase [Candidatus Rokubacteria bacterium]|nr:AAA family ATPase [Candidatus Rokubacteria bacterium]